MLKSITLENYKCFKDKTDIDIAPLTVLCGVNSSGKSSILKSLLMMKQSYENSKSNGEVTYNGEYVNNGNYLTLANNVGEPIIIKNNFVLSYMSSADRVPYKNLYRLTYGESIKSKDCDKKYFPSFFISISVKLRHNKISEYIFNIENEKLNVNSEIKISHNTQNNYNIFINNLVCNCISITTKVYDCFCTFNGIKIISIFTNNLPSTTVDISVIFNYIYNIFTIGSWQFSNNISHIAPLRNFPTRYYNSESIYDSVGLSGENTAQILDKMGKDYFKCVDLPKNDIFKFNPQKDSLLNLVNIWLQYLDVGHCEIPKHEEDILQLKINEHSISDVGFGISQILPIITQGIITQQYQTLLLEQPEIHLHPKAQMKMADLLIALAVSKRTVIVETHSDHIINRITRRVMEDPSLSSLIKIFFVYKDETGNSKINKDISIDPYRGLANCPPEFFDQYGDELRIIMKQAYNNIKNKGDKIENNT